MGQYDQAKRRRAVRRGRERGAWVYLPAVELQAAGIEVGAGAPPPHYRLWSDRRSKSSAGTVIVRLYSEE